MRYYDEAMAQSARNYAFTLDKKWEQRYRTFEPEADKTIKNAIKNSSAKEKIFFEILDKANIALVEMEYKSIELTNKGKSDEAVRLLESKEYESQRKILAGGLDDYVKLCNSIDDQIITLNPSLQTIIDLERKLAVSELISKTERMSSSRELKTSEKKYRDLYETSTEMYRTVNVDGVIMDANSVYLKVLGYSKGEVIGRSIFDHVAEDSLSALQESFNMWKKEGVVRNKEIWFKRKDGTIFPTLLSASNLYDDGKVIGSNTVIKDMTEIYAARKELEETKTQKLMAIGELTARIAHDLRNPLSVIKNVIYLMQLRNSNIDEQNKKDFDRLTRAISRMTHQIDEVLNYVTPKPLDLQKNSIQQILHFVFERITIPSCMIIALPQKDIEIMCDREKLEIVFINLITNAIQAMNNQGKISIRIIDEDTSVLIEVEDDGPGIPNDILPKIFDPLFTTRQIGTGLGLVSCKSIIEKHGGTINVKTKVGVGTTFSIRLPKRKKELGIAFEDIEK